MSDRDHERTNHSARVGRRGAAMLFFCLLDLVYAFGLYSAPRPLVPFYAWMATIMPLGVWAACWGAVGVVCLWYAFRLYDTPGFMAAVALKTAWGLLSLFGWMAGAVDRGWISAVIWLAFAGFVFLIAGGIPPAARRPGGWRPWTR